MTASPRRLRGDDGAALAEFVLVSLLTTGVFLALLQLGLDLYARNMLQSCAADAARYAANADVHSSGAGVGRARQLVGDSLSGLAGTVDVRAADQAVGGDPVVVLDVTADLPTAFGWLPSVPVHVQGRALMEPYEEPR